jgi:hypothetical protein
MPEESRSEEIRSSMIRGPDFRKTYVTRTVTFPTDFDIRIAVSNEAIGKDSENINIVVEEMLILTPTSAKELLNNLGKVVETYEKMFGAIKERPENRLLTEVGRSEILYESWRRSREEQSPPGEEK